MAALGVQVDETFRVFAKRWWRSKQLGPGREHVHRLRAGGSATWSGSSAATGWARSRRGWSTASAMSSHEQAETIRRLMAARSERAAAADGDRHRQARPDLRAPAPAAVEHVDQRDDHAARADPPAGRRLRADRPQPRARRRPLGAVPQAGPPEAHVPRGRRVPRAAGRRRRARGGGAREPQGARTPGDGRDARASRLSDQRDDRSAASRRSICSAAASSSPTRRPRPGCGRSRSRSTCATSCSTT